MMAVFSLHATVSARSFPSFPGKPTNGRDGAQGHGTPCAMHIFLVFLGGGNRPRLLDLHRVSEPVDDVLGRAFCRCVYYAAASLATTTNDDYDDSSMVWKHRAEEPRGSVGFAPSMPPSRNDATVGNKQQTPPNPRSSTTKPAEPPAWMLPFPHTKRVVEMKNQYIETIIQHS